MKKETTMAIDRGQIREWREPRKQEALKIDPETTEVTWWRTNELNPNGDEQELRI
jgi:hypothetical protein